MASGGSAERPGDTPETARPQLIPYDLEAPLQMLIPKYSPYGASKKPVIDDLVLGWAHDGIIIRRYRHADGSVDFQIRAECENVPHCGNCECDGTHLALLTEEQVRDLYQMLES